MWFKHTASFFCVTTACSYSMRWLMESFPVSKSITSCTMQNWREAVLRLICGNGCLSVFMITCAIGNVTYKHKRQILDLEHFLLMPIGRKVGLCISLSSACSVSLVTCLRVSQPRQGPLGYWGIYYLLPTKLWTTLALVCGYEWLSHPVRRYFLVLSVDIYPWTSAYFQIFWLFRNFLLTFSQNQRGSLGGGFKGPDCFLSD